MTRRPKRLTKIPGLEADGSRFLVAANRAEDRLRLKNELQILAERALTEEEVKQGLQLTASDRDMLKLIAAGYRPRNVLSIMQALKVKLEFSQVKPQPEGGKDAAVQVVVNTLQAKVEKYEVPAESSNGTGKVPGA